MTRIFFDMDGVLAEFKDVPYEELLEEGFFLNLKPQTEVVRALEQLSEDPEFEVCTLSAVIPESPYALQEKKDWLKANVLGNFKSIFLPCGESKAEAIPGGIRPTDILVDDYNFNLNDWSKHAVAVKLLNGINHRHGSWKGLIAKNDAGDIKDVIYRAACKAV